MIIASSIEFIKDLGQYEYDNKYYDFHNDYDCEKILLSEKMLTLQFKHCSDNTLVFLCLTDVIITKFDLFSSDLLTLDLLYRGRIEVNGKLIEVSEDGHAYFYLHFYEGQQLEFWAKNIELK